MGLIMTSVKNSFCELWNWDIQEKGKKEEWIGLPHKETKLESIMGLQIQLIIERTNEQSKLRMSADTY